MNPFSSLKTAVNWLLPFAGSPCSVLVNTDANRGTYQYEWRPETFELIDHGPMEPEAAR